MLNFYTGHVFPSWKLLEIFISLEKPGAEKIKTWTQEQRVGRAKQNTDESPVAVDSETNNAFVSALCIKDQLFLFLCKIKLGLFQQDLAERFQISISTVRRTLVTWTNYLHFLLGSLALAVNAWFFFDGVKVAGTYSNDKVSLIISSSMKVFSTLFGSDIKEEKMSDFFRTKFDKMDFIIRIFPSGQHFTYFTETRTPTEVVLNTVKCKPLWAYLFSAAACPCSQMLLWSHAHPT